MTRPTLDSSARAWRRFDGALRGRATGPKLAACLLLGLALAACGDGAGGGSTGGSDSPGVDPAPLATEPVDLPPGQTEALIAWEPSQGVVSGYMVFLSRNGRMFQFQSVVDEARTRVEGIPGDVVRIAVAAIGEDEQTSATSPLSVPIRFHADPNAAPVDEGSPELPPVGGGLPDPTPQPTPDPTPDPTPVPASDPAPDPATDPVPVPVADPTPPADPNPGATPEAPIDSTVLTPTLRARLLLADLQGTLTGLSMSTRAWIAPWLSGEVPIDLDPIATAESTSAGWRDVVWQDASGQLFVSDGPALAEADVPASTLIPGAGLLDGERFVALADLDEDGLRDWIVEDVASGAVSFHSDANAEPQAARAADQADTARLLGAGDFDGDGRAELLWQDEDGSLSLARPDGSLPPLGAGALPPAGYRIIAVADLTGDGCDDLIARSDDGLLAVATSAEVTTDATIDPAADPSVDPSADPAAPSATGKSLGLTWNEGLAEADSSAELIATLDLDADGRAELVWRTDAAVEIRGLGETTPRPF